MIMIVSPLQHVHDGRQAFKYEWHNKLRLKLENKVYKYTEHENIC